MKGNTVGCQIPADYKEDVKTISPQKAAAMGYGPAAPEKAITKPPK